MDSLLRYAYIEQHCNVCGHSYPVTLQETLMEQRLLREWRSPRHCAECESAASPLVSVLGPAELEELERAWQAVATAVSKAGFEMRTGEPSLARHE